MSNPSPFAKELAEKLSELITVKASPSLCDTYDAYEAVFDENAAAALIDRELETAKFEMRNAILQIEYLHDRLGQQTGTGNRAIAALSATLRRFEKE